MNDPLVVGSLREGKQNYLDFVTILCERVPRANLWSEAIAVKSSVDFTVI